MNKYGYCYFVDLTPSEEQDVHNPDGLRRLEVRNSGGHTEPRGFDSFFQLPQLVKLFEMI